MNELMFNAHFPAALHNSHFLCHRRVSSAAAFSASASFLPFVIAMMEHYGSGAAKVRYSWQFRFLRFEAKLSLLRRFGTIEYLVSYCQ